MSQLASLDQLGLFSSLLELNHDTRQQLAKLLRVEEDDLDGLRDSLVDLPLGPFYESRLIAYCMKNGLSDLLTKYGVTPPSYNIFDEFDFETEPLGKESKLLFKLV